MATQHSRRGFTLVELLVVIAIIGVLVALLLPAINAARVAAQRQVCNARVKQLATALLNYESANKRFPLANDSDGRLLDMTPGDETELTGSGFSWIVHLLPYIEANQLYDNIKSGSDSFRLAAFDQNIADIDTNDPLWMRAIPVLVCPSYSGSVDGVIDALAEHTSQEYNEQEKPGLTNYLAMVSTDLGHMTAMTGGSDSGERTDYQGIIVPKCATVRATRDNDNNSQDQSMCREKGTSIQMIKDGTATTIMVAESREATYAAWYDGATSWLIGMREDAVVQVPSGSEEGDRRMRVTEGEHALNYGPGGNNLQAYFLSEGSWGGGNRAWGPSSEHGIVHHCFADGHSQGLNIQIEADVYLALITKRGNENVKPEDLE